jgi:hypothetical protein
MTKFGAANTWFNQMKTIWLEKRPDDMAFILSDNVEYHENPLEPPLTTKEAVVQVWQEIKNQNIALVEIETLYEMSNIGFAIWRFQEHGYSLHVGSYYLELDDEGKCKVFRQWWNVAA